MTPTAHRALRIIASAPGSITAGEMALELRAWKTPQAATRWGASYANHLRLKGWIAINWHEEPDTGWRWVYITPAGHAALLAADRAEQERHNRQFMGLVQP